MEKILQLLQANHFQNIIAYFFVLFIFILAIVFYIFIRKKYKFNLFVFRIKRLFLIILQPIFKKDNYILFDNLYENNVECIDTYCIFQYMQKHNIKSKYLIYKKNSLYEKIKNNKDVILIEESIHNHKSFEFFNKTYKYLFKTKAVITSFGDISNNKITKFLYKNKYIQYIHVGHGSVFLKTFVLSTPYFSQSKYNKFIVSNEIEQKIFMDYGWKKENLPIIGLPRWENLKREPQKQKTIFMMFTWRTSFGKWNKNKFKTPYKETEYYKGIFNLLNNKKFNEILVKNNIKLIYTLHHALVSQFDDIDKLKFSNTEYVSMENISQYIGKADLFITDYSSIFFDFLYLDIPVIFYRPDFQDDTLLELDKKDIKHAISMDRYLFNTCYFIDEVNNTLAKYIKNNFTLEEEYKDKASKLFFNKNNITQKLIDYMEKL